MTKSTQTETPFDPTVDIMVGLASVVLLAVLLILPFAQLQSERADVLEQVSRDLNMPLDLTHKGQPVLQIVAHKAAVTLVRKAGNHDVALDRLFDDDELASTLAQAQRDMEHPVIFIENSGQEAAFVLETILAQHQFPEISRVFLDPSCGFFQRDAVPKRCTPSGYAQ